MSHAIPNAPPKLGKPRQVISVLIIQDQSIDFKAKQIDLAAPPAPTTAIGPEDGLNFGK